VSFWCGWWELNRVAKYSQDHLFEVVESAYPDHPAVKRLREDLTKKSPLRIVQLILAVLLTLVIIVFVLMIWNPGSSQLDHHRHDHFDSYGQQL